MNAISITMVKRMDVHALQGYAFRLTVSTVVLSWIGWQALLISGADHVQGARTHALFFFEAGLVLLFYSLFSLLRLMRTEALPARESIQLLFGVLLAGLPPLTWLVWRHIRFLLADRNQHALGNAANTSLLYACILVSLVYLAMMLVWLQTSVASYSDARPGSWPQRTMQCLHAMVINPYFK
jgi:hypothetical protein